MLRFAGVACFSYFLRGLRAVWLAGCWLAVASASGVALAGEPQPPAASPLPQHFQLGGHQLVMNGAGIRHKAVFKVYHATLYLEQQAHSLAEVLQLPGPKRLEIHMLRDIDANELGKLFTKGIEQNTPRQELGRVLPGVAQMSAVFSHQKKLHKGDSFSLDWVPNVGMTLSINGQPQSPQFENPAFFAALLGIWLGDKPADAQLKQALLGQAVNTADTQ